VKAAIRADLDLMQRTRAMASGRTTTSRAVVANGAGAVENYGYPSMGLRLDVACGGDAFVIHEVHCPFISVP
jgi:hypothetical protein